MSALTARPACFSGTDRALHVGERLLASALIADGVGIARACHGRV
jgi:hypothetical protein